MPWSVLHETSHFLYCVIHTIWTVQAQVDRFSSHYAPDQIILTLRQDRQPVCNKLKLALSTRIGPSVLQTINLPSIILRTNDLLYGILFHRANKCIFLEERVPTHRQMYMFINVDTNATNNIDSVSVSSKNVTTHRSNIFSDCRGYLQKRYIPELL